MKLDLEKLRQTLVRAARIDAPSESVPYAFEQRIIARLRPTAMPNGWMLWGRALWRAAAACVIVAALSSVWSFWPGSDIEPATLESTVFAAAEQPLDSW